MTPSESPSPTPHSDAKLTLDNLGEWDKAIAEAKGEEGQIEAPPPDDEDQETPEEVIARKLAEGEKVDPDKEEKPPEDEPPAKDDRRPPSRDYSKFDPADVPFLKQMSNQAFKHMSERLESFKTSIAEKDAALAEVAQGKNLPDDWYNDPAAGEASPEYKSVKVEFDKAQAETHRLGILLDSYEEGRLKYDPQTGQFVPNDDETPPSKALVRKISDARAELYEKQKELAVKGNGVLQNFGRVYSTAATEVDTVTEKMLPWSKDEKHAWNKPFKDLLAKVPKVFRNHPLARQNAALAAAAISYKILAEDREKQLKAKAGVLQDQRRAGPSPNRGGRSNGSEIDKKFTIADFSG